MRSRALLAFLAAVALILALAAPALAATTGSGTTGEKMGQPSDARPTQTLTRPTSRTRPPPFYRLSARRATAIANQVPKARDEVRKQRAAGHRITHDAFTKGPGLWQVSYYAHGDEVAQVIVNDQTGLAVEAWTGPQVAWFMARGTPGAFGRKVNAPYIWIPLMVLFVLPFVDPRRPFRLLHLDLAVLLAFSVSHYWFNRGEVLTSVPLAYPVLAYLLARMLLAGYVRRFRERPEPLRLLVPATWLALAVVFLIGFRVGLNVTNSNVIDVGYSGVIGADRLSHGDSLYGNFPADDPSGDTYGPAAYYAYVPFELALPWKGSWDTLPAAHGAAILFDLATILGLFLLGRRLRPGQAGRVLGIALAYGWATYPYTLFVSNSNSNDSLVAMVLVYALLMLRWAPARGAMMAIAGLTKFVPLVLAPLWGSYPRLFSRPASKLAYAAAFAGTAALLLLPVVLGPHLHLFYERTIGYQLGRGSPFSIWGQHGGLDWLQQVVKAGALVLALAVCFVPRTKDALQVAALSAAILVAVQIGMTHWFYLYIVWFFPFVMVSLLGGYGAPGTDPEPGSQPSLPG